MSCNAAEAFTLNYAIKAIIDRGIDPKETVLSIVGDSKIVLGWARKNRKQSSKSTPEFREAIIDLRYLVSQFKTVSAYWQPRLKSVATFGH